MESGLTNSELRVRVQNGDARRVHTFSARQTVWIGRDSTCDIVLPAQEVSRRHASLFVRDGALFVRDHSSYGMQIEGRSLWRAVRAVRPPSALELGPYRLEVTLVGDMVQLRVGATSRLAGLRRWRALLFGLFALLATGSWGLRMWQPAADGAELSVGEPAPCPRPSSARGPAPTVAGAVERLRSGDRLGALHAYRALAARDQSRAEFSIIASLLARELSCRP